MVKIGQFKIVSDYFGPTFCFVLLSNTLANSNGHFFVIKNPIDFLSWKEQSAEPKDMKQKEARCGLYYVSNLVLSFFGWGGGVMGGGGGHSDASSIRFHTKQWAAVGSSSRLCLQI